MFRVCGRSPRRSSARHAAALLTFRRFFLGMFTAFQRLLSWGSARWCLLASSLCCHAALISASASGLMHQTCAPRGRLERGVSSAAVESMTLAMSVAKSVMQVPSRIGGSAASKFRTLTTHRPIMVEFYSLTFSCLPLRKPEYLSFPLFFWSTRDHSFLVKSVDTPSPEVRATVFGKMM